MNIPNILTSIRIALIPMFVVLFYMNQLMLALLTFVVAGITDVLDGYIARKYNLVSDVGKVLDPLADKLMLMAVLICLASANLVPFWVLIIIAIKEVFMVYGGIRLYFSKTQIIIPSNIYGKLGTVAFYFAIFLVLIEAPSLLASSVMYFAIVVALIAFYKYLRIALEAKTQEISK